MPAVEPISSLPTLLDAAAAAGTGGLRFVDRHERAEFHSWSEIAARSEYAAGQLGSRGIQAGDRVGIILRTSPAFFDAFFGVLALQAVPVPLYPPVRLGRLAEYHRRTGAMLDAVDANLIVTEPTIARLLGETVAATRRAELFTLEPPPAGSASGCAAAARGADSGDVALIQFSSGTTVAPKAVALTHRAILEQTRILNDHWRHHPAASGVSWLPLYHDMGLIGCVFPALELAAELTLVPPEFFVARPAIWLRALSRYRALVSPAPNFAYGLCLEKIVDHELEGVDLSAWRVALNGAESVSADVMRRFNERFARWGLRPEALTPVYGLSEASLAIAFSDLDSPFVSRRFDRSALAQSRAEPAADGTELVSVGKPLPGFEVEIRGPDRQVLPEREIGRLWVRGPSLMSGYWGQPLATAEVLVDGWLDTGDLGFVESGLLFLAGRSKDLLIVRGRNHAPEEVERAVDGIPDVRTGCSAAVGRTAEDSDGESILLFVERRRRVPDDDRELAEACRARVLTNTGLELDEVVVLAPGTLPRTSSGKIRRAEALRRFLAGELQAPDRVSAWSLFKAMIRSRRALGRRDTRA